MHIQEVPCDGSTHVYNVCCQIRVKISIPIHIHLIMVKTFRVLFLKKVHTMICSHPGTQLKSTLISTNYNLVLIPPQLLVASIILSLLTRSPITDCRGVKSCGLCTLCLLHLMTSSTSHAAANQISSFQQTVLLSVCATLSLYIYQQNDTRFVSISCLQ